MGMLVTKADGRTEKFDRKKIAKTCINAGLPAAKAEAVAKYIEKSVTDGTATHRIYQMILTELRKYDERTPLIYRLREAVARLDPEAFEIFIVKVLEAYGYKCEWNVIIDGEIIEHQVDITAKNGGSYMVECKKHFNPHRDCGLGEIMEVWARLDDINRGRSRHFDAAWVITNTKFSEHAKKYAKGKEMRLTGWRHKGRDSLERLLHSKKIYPVTILGIDGKTTGRLVQNGFIGLNDVISRREELYKTGVDKKTASKIISQAKTLINNKSQ